MWSNRRLAVLERQRGVIAQRGQGRPQGKVLSVAAQNNRAALLPLFRWFRLLQVEHRQPRARGLGAQSATFISERFSNQLALFAEEEERTSAAREAILELLRAADTGIVDLKVEELDPGRSLGSRIQHPRLRLQFCHKSEEPEHGRTWLPLEVESAGTVALVELAPQLLRALRNGGLVCIDEMEASLHPMLGLALLRLFQNPRQNVKGAQLLFTTHDTNLLGNALGEAPLRRDQIWFTEKDASGAAHLYPLTDFHPRKQENLERGYLQGRYGAIPYLGELAAEPLPAVRLKGSSVPRRGNASKSTRCRGGAPQ